MKDQWFGDKRDVVKWGVLLTLAERFSAARILQIAYYRPSAFGPLIIDGQQSAVPLEVLQLFRDIRGAAAINSRIRVTIYDNVFLDRAAYQHGVLALLQGFIAERCVVFLDPDTGLEPQGNADLQHVLDAEVQAIWNNMKPMDIFVFYQHQTNRAGQEWIEPKRTQLAQALNLGNGDIKVASGPEIA
ncbi:MAG: hypothetical protein ABSH22_22495, partial [Tepidisphaeraceae bacterium]